MPWWKAMADRSSIGCRNGGDCSPGDDPLSHSFDSARATVVEVLQASTVPLPRQRHAPSNDTVQLNLADRSGLELAVPKRARWQAAGGHTDSVRERPESDSREDRCPLRPATGRADVASDCPAGRGEQRRV